MLLEKHSSGAVGENAVSNQMVWRRALLEVERTEFDTNEQNRCVGVASAD